MRSARPSLVLCRPLPSFARLQIGKMRVRRSGSDVALIGYGAPVNDCLAAAEMLELVRVRRCLAAQAASASRESSLQLGRTAAGTRHVCRPRALRPCPTPCLLSTVRGVCHSGGRTLLQAA